jgi:hypothetical protein
VGATDVDQKTVPVIFLDAPADFADGGPVDHQNQIAGKGPGGANGVAKARPQGVDQGIPLGLLPIGHHRVPFPGRLCRLGGFALRLGLGRRRSLLLRRSFLFRRLILGVAHDAL